MSSDESSNKISDKEDIKEKKTRNRPSKKEKYKDEREELTSELEKMMRLTEESRGVLLYDLEKNDELKEYLTENIETIKKIFKCGGWNYFIKSDNEIEKDKIGLLKSIFRDEKYEIISKRQYKEINGNKKQYTYLYFMKNIILNEHTKNK